MHYTPVRLHGLDRNNFTCGKYDPPVSNALCYELVGCRCFDTLMYYDSSECVTIATKNKYIVHTRWETGHYQY
jgi:hypothetical protein